MPGPFIPVWAISRSQNVRIGNRSSGAGNHTVPMLTKNPSTAALPTPYLVDLSDGTSRRDLAHHLALGAVIPARGLRLTSALAANTAALGAGPTAVNNLPIPAGALNVGASVRITVQGVTSATGNVTISARVGAAGTVADATLLSQTVAGATGGGGFAWEFLANVQAVGSGTAGKLLPNAQFAAHANATSLSNNVAQVSVDTTINEFITVAIGVSAGTVTVTNSLIEFLDSAY